ncbi:hypothetical protein ACWGUP_26310 [Streptomyces diastaticus]|uniref:hypothetical protein n=1 Tax=Streptomyces diastaticus TaxID=1956 RepID=UPI00343C4220
MTDSTRPTAPGPHPEPIRFFGTTWLDHSGHYGLRRAGVAAGSLALAVACAVLLRIGYQGMALAEVGRLINVLVVGMFAICTAIAFGRTLRSFTKREDPERRQSLRGLMAIGFLGVLVAWSVRSLREAPGEGLHRAEYEEAVARATRRRARRTGHPGRRAGH